MSTALPVATRHHRDMIEKLLKATLNPNKQQHDSQIMMKKTQGNKYIKDGNLMIIKTKKNVCVFQVSALNKLGMLGRHYFIVMFYMEIEFLTTFPPNFQHI